MPVINTTDNQRNQLSDNWSPYDPVHKRLRRHTSFQLKIKERRLNTLQLPYNLKHQQHRLRTFIGDYFI